jgi:hypothetical protein
MVEIAKFFLQLIIVFLIIYCLFYIFEYKRIKKYDRKKSPINIKYLVYKYNIDVVKIGFKRLYKTLLLCDSFIISFVFTITGFIDVIYIRFLVVFILIFPFIGFIYHLIAMYYIKESE